MAYIPIRPTLAATAKDYLALGPRKRITVAALHGCPSGDGSAVLVLPGIGRSDAQTKLFRESLTTLGYHAVGWNLGVNAGPSRQLMEGVTTRLAELAAKHGNVRLIGFSMGGLFARWLAHRRTSLVRQVISVASPFRDPVESAWMPIRPFLPLWRDIDIGALSYMIGQPPPVPWASLYTRRDGIVAWQSCFDPAAPDRCFEVDCRHRLAPYEAEVFQRVAACLGEQ
jgi:pimeloyl-ACP methyl ester carboxylesterase